MPASSSTRASSTQLSRSIAPYSPRASSAAIGATAAESTNSAGAGRNDIDAVGLDAAVGLARSGHRDRLALLQVGGLADDGLAHDHTLVEGDLDVGVAAGVMNRQAVAGQVGDGAGRAAAGPRARGAGRGGGAGTGTGGSHAAAPETVSRRPGARCRRGGGGGRATRTDFVTTVETAE